MIAGALKKLARLLRNWLADLGLSAWERAGARYARRWPSSHDASPELLKTDVLNPLLRFFQDHKSGPGVWKWIHYFEAYHRHLERFRNTSPRILEVGIYSGGSLEMWKDYFGPGCQIYGVDIEPACKAYETDAVRVLIGDQADRTFWRHALANGTIPLLDAVIDDGGHEPIQQRITLEELLPHVRPGGVYICEDIHGQDNEFAAYIAGLIHELNATAFGILESEDPERRLSAIPTGFQSAIHSIHCYPFLTVIEKSAIPIPEFRCPKRGSQWEPFL